MPTPLPDLSATLQALRAGHTSARQEVELALARAAAPACQGAFLRLQPQAALAQADAADQARRASAGGASSPSGSHLTLGGLPVSVKDLFDLAGQPTPAGSRVLQDAAPAARDAAAVARLRGAGASVLGRTHMTEFAFSGVGTNPHFPVPANPATALLDATPRIPGGSSSGAAVSVATGAAFIGLGSDTGGSIRIPAALCGIVGFKNTARLTPLDGALPLSTTLDTACAMTRSVRDAILAHEVLAARRVTRSGAPLSAYRLAVPTTTFLDEVEPAVASAFERALQRLRTAGARIEEIPLEPVRDLGSLQAKGGFAAAESYAWHHALLQSRGQGYDPRVRLRIERGAQMAAWEYLQLVDERRRWIERCQRATQGFDALLSPTVPVLAPPIETLAPADGVDAAQDTLRDEAFFRLNALLLRNPSIVNLLDGCAISLPCHDAGELPVGLMIWQGSLHDDTVLNIALQAESALAQGPTFFSSPTP